MIGRLPASPFGERCYGIGCALVAEHGIHPRHVMWDADETLWDWLMSASRVFVRLPVLAARRSLAHREYVRVRAGMFELLQGMHDAAVDAGDDDPFMRIWTNGYAWRMWAIARGIPGFAELLGLDADADAQAWARCERAFYRADYARAARHLLTPERREAVLSGLSPEGRRAIEDQLGRRTPLDSNLKLPELAGLPDPDAPDRPVKRGFAEIRFLIDDHGANVGRFVGSGRRGVHVVSNAPRTLRGKVPNSTWGRPFRVLRGLERQVSLAIGEALAELAGESPPAQRAAASTERVPRPYPWIEHVVDIPDAVLRAEWVAPMDELRARAPAHLRAKKRGWH